jgi:hypothetical protein
MDFDETRLYYSHQQLQTFSSAGAEAQGDAVGEHHHQNVPVPTQQEQDDEHDAINLAACRRHFREFLRKCEDENVWMCLGQS